MRYLEGHFRGGAEDRHASRAESDQMLQMTLRTMRGDFEAAGIHPLPNPWAV